LGQTTDAGKLSNEKRMSQITFTGTESRADRYNVLNVGSGTYVAGRLHPLFCTPIWQETRLDIDERVQPDVVGSITDMKAIENERFDAIWCSHILEHLHTWQVGNALSEFRRVLKPTGFVLIRSPDLEAVAQLVVEGQLETVAYQAPLGPITALDMIFGHSTSIERGNDFMAHHTGFTVERLGRLLLEAGFIEARVNRAPGFELWALAILPQVDRSALLAELRRNGLGRLADD
jgi:predicted SAM-dependent methyltransferase